MSHRVCPWWLGYFLASPLRRMLYTPEKILNPFVREGMTVLEPGPGMGFFTLELARMVGPGGHVVAVDIQPKMLDRLKRRASKSGVLGQLEIRLAQPNSLGVADLAGTVDLVLAFAVVHELPSARVFFGEAFQALKPGGALLLAEPSGHVKGPDFEAEIGLAGEAGLHEEIRPTIRSNHAVLLRKR